MDLKPDALADLPGDSLIQSGAWIAITDLVLKRNGIIAWVAEGLGEGSSEGPMIEGEVGISDSSGATAAEVGLVSRRIPLDLMDRASCGGHRICWLEHGAIATRAPCG